MSKRKIFDMGRGLAKAEELMPPWSRLELSKRWDQSRETSMRQDLGTFVGVDPALSEDRTYVTCRPFDVESIRTAFRPSLGEGPRRDRTILILAGNYHQYLDYLRTEGIPPTMESARVREGSTTACADCGALVDTGAVYQSVRDPNRLLCEPCFQGAMCGGRARVREP